MIYFKVFIRWSNYNMYYKLDIIIIDCVLIIDSSLFFILGFKKLIIYLISLLFIL
jgi:hypothetical protein